MQALQIGALYSKGGENPNWSVNQQTWILDDC